MAKKLQLGDVDLSRKLKDKAEYEKRLESAQLLLLYIQRTIHIAKRRAVIVFEGWDAAGKGGSIRRLVEMLDPRGYVVHPIGAPSEDQKLCHYFRRFWERMPDPGQIAIFDRSWYGRVLVERVEGYAEKTAWKRAFDEINAVERMYVDDGVPVLKYYLHISKDEQLRRFQEREKDPFKHWKLGADDWRNREKWDQYVEAVDDMLSQTSTKAAPWNLIAAEHKWLARVEVAEHCVNELARCFEIDLTLPRGWRKLAD